MAIQRAGNDLPRDPQGSAPARFAPLVPFYSWIERVKGFFLPFYAWLERVYGLDLRSLALFRVAMALLYIGDFALRSLDIVPHYSDFGLLPRSVLLDRFSNPTNISIFFISGNSAVIGALMAVAVAFGFAMLLGYRTRLATFLCWFMTISIQNRNPAVLQGGDVLFRMLLFWAMFLPIGEYWSVDSGLDNSDLPKPKRVFNFASLGLMLQICFLYWFAFLLKTGPEWRQYGNAVWFALSIDQMGTPVGGLLLHFPYLLRLLTYFTLAVELLAPFFLLVPIYFGQWRSTAVLILAGLQLSFGTCIRLGHFPFIASSMMVAMLPTWYWENVRPNAAHKRPKPLFAYYDEKCGFCVRSIFILKSIAFPPQTVLLPAQGTKGLNDEMAANRSWIVVDEYGVHHYKADAMAVLLERGLVWRPLAWLLRRPILMRWSNRLYDWVESHRTMLSRRLSFLRFRPQLYRLRPVTHALAAFCVALMVLWNISTLPKFRWVRFPRPIWQFANMLRIDQKWDMFSPGPLLDDGWYVIDGTLHNGRHVDVFAGGVPVSFATKTRSQIAAQYPRERWRKYYMNLYLRDFEDYRLWYGRYICRNWNGHLRYNDPNQLDSFDVDFFMRTNSPPFVDEPDYKRMTIHHHECFDRR